MCFFFGIFELTTDNYFEKEGECMLRGLLVLPIETDERRGAITEHALTIPTHMYSFTVPFPRSIVVSFPGCIGTRLVQYSRDVY